MTTITLTLNDERNHHTIQLAPSKEVLNWIENIRADYLVTGQQHADTAAGAIVAHDALDRANDDLQLARQYKRAARILDNICDKLEAVLEVTADGEAAAAA